MILLAFLFIAVLMQVPAEAPPTLEQVRAMLVSSDAKDQAWGAWWTSEARLGNLEPMLQKNLEAHVNGSDWQDASVMDATLDAYIQSNSTPPPVELLESVYARRPTPALILLSRIRSTEQVDAFLLKLVRTEASRGEAHEWFAAANMLVAHRAPGFVAAVLRDLRINATVTVCESGSPCPLRGPGKIFADGGFGGAPTPGFPPSVTYLPIFPSSPYAVSISTILMGGPEPVSYSRKASPAHYPAPVNGRMPGSVDPPRPSTSDRLRYIVAALDSMSANRPSLRRLPIQDNESRVIQWKTESAFVAEVEQIRQDIQKRYTDMIQQLVSNQLLTAEETRELAIVRTDVVIVDRRIVNRTPLRVATP